ncbi:hypothetical protein ABZ738_03715 [Micromonospora sp. NPDC047793]|uniref:hypothetical protein n=1 Tax=unclassified Micromonospora TaxID=2617518 RepID=UPI001034F08B|nr:hypothetical protein [Verrucosispora sp. SN26_14.1]TBL40893.1 hypothetical protein EYA84_06420 [Verrucosispora sp. SN26_14.1]
MNVRWSRISATEKASYGGAAIAASATVAVAVVQGAVPLLAGQGGAVAVAVVSFLAGVAVTGATVAVVATVRRRSLAGDGPEFDVFVSTPMASLPKSEYPAHRRQIMTLIREIEQRAGLSCYYAGRDRPEIADFPAVDLGFRDELRALTHSRHFLLVLPVSNPSSALVEAGVAIALRTPSIYFRHTSAVLPFLLRGAANSNHPDIPRIRVYEYADFSELATLVRVNGKGLFESHT